MRAVSTLWTRCVVSGMTRLLNRSEEITFEILSKSVLGKARVFPKVRVADAVTLNGSGVTDELFRYGLQAHFDFVLTSSDYEPLFAVEFDGPLHQTSETQRERDIKKYAICKHLEFPMLRINSRYVDRKYRGMDLLSYFVDVWFLADAFYEAQANGIVPYDEPFDPTFILNDGSSPNRWPYWLSWESQMRIQSLQKSGKIHSYFPCHWTGVDANEAYRSIVWLEVAPGKFIFTRTGMRAQLFPAYCSDILFQISVLDIEKLIDGYLAGTNDSVLWEDIHPVVSDYKDRFDLRSCGGIASK